MIGSLLMTVCITLANVLAISGHENCCKCDCDAQRQHIYYAPPLEAAATHQFVQPVLINHHLLVQPEVQQNEQRQVHNVVVVEAGGSTAATLKEAAPLPPEAEEEQQSSQSNKKTRYQYKLTHPHSKATHYVTFQQTHLNKPETSSEENNHYHKDKNIHYKFEYAVNDQKTHDIKHHKEERNGDVVKGEYSLVEDDGNVRTVKYYADWKSGFHAQVHNSKSQSKQAISG